MHANKKYKYTAYIIQINKMQRQITKIYKNYFVCKRHGNESFS